MSAKSYFELVYLIKLGRTQRPLKLSVLNCSMVYGASRLLQSRINWMHQHFAKDPAEVPVPKWSTLYVDEDIRLQFHRHFTLAFRKVLFPYTDTLFAWLENCLEMAQNLEDDLLCQGFDW